MHIVGRVHHIPVRACDLRAHRACCRDRAPGRLDRHDRPKNARCGRRIGDRTSQGRGDADGHRAEGGFSWICRAAFASASAIGRRRAAASTAAGFGTRRCRCGCESGSTCAGGGTAPGSTRDAQRGFTARSAQPQAHPAPDSSSSSAPSASGGGGPAPPVRGFALVARAPRFPAVQIEPCNLLMLPARVHRRRLHAGRASTGKKRAPLPTGSTAPTVPPRRLVRTPVRLGPPRTSDRRALTPVRSLAPRRARLPSHRPRANALPPRRLAARPSVPPVSSAWPNVAGRPPWPNRALRRRGRQVLGRPRLVSRPPERRSVRRRGRLPPDSSARSSEASRPECDPGENRAFRRSGARPSRTLISAFAPRQPARNAFRPAARGHGGSLMAYASARSTCSSNRVSEPGFACRVRGAVFFGIVRRLCVSCSVLA